MSQPLENGSYLGEFETKSCFFIPKAEKFFYEVEPFLAFWIALDIFLAGIGVGMFIMGQTLTHAW